jgi:Domain of unknown function (DUF4129)
VSRLADVPVVPDAGQGRAWAREELAGPGYERPGLIRRGLEWLVERLQQLPLPHGSGSALTAAVLVVVVAVVVIWAVRRGGGPLARGRAGDGDAVFEPGARSAEQHRVDADLAAAAGEWRTATLERFRAVVRELEEQGVVPEQPGRTAGETADAAGVRMPALAADLRGAARLFGDVRYGGRDPGPAGDAALRDLDERLRGARTGRLPERAAAP